MQLPLSHRNWSLLQLREGSSLQSPQSLSPSSTYLDDTQLPLSQLNCELVQGQFVSSLLSPQSLSPSHL